MFLKTITNFCSNDTPESHLQTYKNERGSSAALSAAEQSSMMKAFEYTYT